MSKLSRIPDKTFGSSPDPHAPIRHHKIRVAPLDSERRIPRIDVARRPRGAVLSDRSGGCNVRARQFHAVVRTLDRERQRGLKLGDGISGPAERRRFRPFQFVATELQRAYSSLARGDTG